MANITYLLTYTTLYGTVDNDYEVGQKIDVLKS